MKIFFLGLVVVIDDEDYLSITSREPSCLGIADNAFFLRMLN